MPDSVDIVVSCSSSVQMIMGLANALDHTLVCQILKRVSVQILIIESLLVFNSYVWILSIIADFMHVKDVVASDSASSSGSLYSSVSVSCGWVRTSGSPFRWWHHISSQYCTYRSIIPCFNLMRFPVISWMLLLLCCFSIMHSLIT